MKVKSRRTAVFNNFTKQVDLEELSSCIRGANDRRELDATITVLATLRMDQVMGAKINDMVFMNELEHARELLLQSNQTQSKIVIDSLLRQSDLEVDQDIIVLPYLHQIAFRLTKGHLLEWITESGECITQLQNNYHFVLHDSTSNTQQTSSPIKVSPVPFSFTPRHHLVNAALASPKTPWWLVTSNIRELHQLGLFGDGEMIGVLDSGIDSRHLKLKGKCSVFAEIDQFGQVVSRKVIADDGCHGTKVSYLLVGGTSASPESAAPSARLAVVRILNGPALQESGTLVQAATGANSLASMKHNQGLPIFVANLSLQIMQSPPDLGTLQTSLFALETINEIQPVLAAGNAGPNTQTKLRGYGLSVGAADHHSNVWQMSSDFPDILAPGAALEVAQPAISQLSFSSYGTYDGTSLAAPLVSGTLAVLRSATRRPMDDCVNALLSSAIGQSPKKQRRRQGWGYLDAKGAYDILQSNSGPIPPP